MACTISSEDIKRVKGMGFLHNKGTECFSARVLTVNGRLTAEEMACLTEAAKQFGTGELTLTVRLTIEVPGIPFDKIPDFQAYIAKAGLVTGGTGPLVRPVVACKGSTCQYGLYDTAALAAKIHDKFYLGYHDVKLPHKFKIATGGCPNNCVKPDLNDLGIIGQLVPEVDLDACSGCKKCKIEESCPMKAAQVVDGKIVIDSSLCNNCGRCVGKCPFRAFDKSRPGYRLYIGGRWGKKMDRGLPLGKVLTSEEELMEVIEKTICFYRDKGNPGERFADTIQRLGFEAVEAALLG